MFNSSSGDGSGNSGIFGKFQKVDDDTASSGGAPGFAMKSGTSFSFGSGSNSGAGLFSRTSGGSLFGGAKAGGLFGASVDGSKGSLMNRASEEPPALMKVGGSGFGGLFSKHAESSTETAVDPKLLFSGSAASGSKGPALVSDLEANVPLPCSTTAEDFIEDAVPLSFPISDKINSEPTEEEVLIEDGVLDTIDEVSVFSLSPLEEPVGEELPGDIPSDALVHVVQAPTRHRTPPPSLPPRKETPLPLRKEVRGPPTVAERKAPPPPPPPAAAAARARAPSPAPPPPPSLRKAPAARPLPSPRAETTPVAPPKPVMEVAPVKRPAPCAPLPKSVPSVVPVAKVTRAAVSAKTAPASSSRSHVGATSTPIPAVTSVAPTLAQQEATVEAFMQVSSSASTMLTGLQQSESGPLSDMEKAVEHLANRRQHMHEARQRLLSLEDALDEMCDRLADVLVRSVSVRASLAQARDPLLESKVADLVENRLPKMTEEIRTALDQRKMALVNC